MKQHSPLFLTLVSDAKKEICEITPQALKTFIDSKEPFTLIDVREKDELTTGIIPGAIHLSKGVIERDIAKHVNDIKTPIVVYCSGGFRCALVALSLKKMGFNHISSLSTGSQGWSDAGYPLKNMARIDEESKTTNQFITIANQWFDAFNEHDLEKLLSLYHNEAKHYSPKLKVQHPETEGLIKGKDALRSWWQNAFEHIPSLKYVPQRIMTQEFTIFMEYLRYAEGEKVLPVGEVLEVKDSLIIASRVYHG